MLSPSLPKGIVFVGLISLGDGWYSMLLRTSSVALPKGGNSMAPSWPCSVNTRSYVACSGAMKPEEMSFLRRLAFLRLPDGSSPCAAGAWVYKAVRLASIFQACVPGSRTFFAARLFRFLLSCVLRSPS